MNLSKGLELTKRFYPLVLIPIVLDLLQIEDILRRARGFTLKFTVPSAVPSITQILADQPQDGGGFSINLPFGYMGGAFLLIFILFILVSSFLKAGFLGCVYSGVNLREVSIDTFISYGKKFFGRFLLQFVITFLLVMIVAPFFLVFGPFAILILIAIFILFFYLTFWDYILIAENERLFDAAKISLQLVHSNLGKVFAFILPIVLITALFGIIVNAVIGASLVFAIIGIFAYAFFGTVVVFAMMSFYLESLR